MADISDAAAMGNESRKQISPTFIAIILLAVRGFAALAMALSTLLMAWVLTPDEMGIALTLISAAMLASIPISLNVEMGAMRFLTAARRDKRDDIIHGFLHFSSRIITALSVPIMLGFAALMAIFAVGSASLAGVAIAACMIPLMAITRSTARQAGALNHVIRGGMPQLIIRPILVLLSLTMAVLSGLRLTIETVLLLFFVGTAVTALIQKLLLAPILEPIKSALIDDTNAPEWAVTGLRLTPSLLFQDLLRDLIIVLAALGLIADSAGILAVCLAIILVPNLALIAIEIGFGPQISTAMTQSNDSRLKELLRQSAILRLLSVLPAFILIQIFCIPMLSFFGPEYRSGETSLRILALIPVTKAIFGNPTLLLNIAGHSKVILKITSMGLVILAISVPVAAVLFGIVGAGVAATSGFWFTQYWLYTACGRSEVADPSAFIFFRRADDVASAKA